MGGYLSRELRKYYTRKGNRVIFSNGMTLNQFALEMWEKMGYGGTDSSILSKVVNGKRTFNVRQLNTLSSILSLSEAASINLKKSALLEIANRYGLSGLLLAEFSDAEKGGTKGLSGKKPNILDKAKTEYFNTLLNDHNINRSALDYFNELMGRFWRGEYDGILPELEDFERLIIKSGFLKKKQRESWLTAISSVRGTVFTHQLSDNILENDYNIAERELGKVYEYADGPFKITLLNGWSAVMRLNAEAAARKNNLDKSLRLLIRSKELQEEAINLLSENNPLGICATTGLMAIVEDIEMLFPKQSKYLLEKNRRSDYLYDSGANLCSKFGKEAKVHEVCLYEFRARWGLKKIRLLLVDGAKLVEEKLERQVIEEVSKAERAVASLGGESGVIGTNFWVTKVNTYITLGQKAPPDLMRKALKSVIKSRDFEQGYRLIHGD